MYAKPIPYDDFMDMMGEPTEEDLKKNKEILKKRKTKITSSVSPTPKEETQHLTKDLLATYAEAAKAIEEELDTQRINTNSAYKDIEVNNMSETELKSEFASDEQRKAFFATHSDLVAGLSKNSKEPEIYRALVLQSKLDYKKKISKNMTPEDLELDKALYFKMKEVKGNEFNLAYKKFQTRKKEPGEY